jgi:hypothetical protein
MLPFVYFGLGKKSSGVEMLPFASLYVILLLDWRMQFADYRAHLIPGFRRVNMAFAALVAAFTVIVLPAIYTLLRGWPSIGYMGAAAVLFGMQAIGESNWSRSPVSAGIVGSWRGVFRLLCTIAAYIVVFRYFAAAIAYLGELFIGEHERMAVGLLVSGILLTLLACRRFVQHGEEQVMTYLQLSIGLLFSGMLVPLLPGVEKAWRQKFNEIVGRLPGLMGWFTERHMARLTRHARQASVSKWSRIYRWQTGMIVGWSLVFWVVIALALAGDFTCQLMRDDIPAQRQSQARHFVIMIVFFGSTIATTAMCLSTFKLGRSLLLPVTRRDLLWQFGLASALGHLQLFACLAAALAAPYLLLAAPPQVEFLALVALISCAFQCALFGGAMWTRSSEGVVAVALLIVFVVVPIGCVAGVYIQSAVVGFWTAIGLCVLLGVLMTVAGYRRWLAADFD